jgi:hypothetical protein
MEAKSLVEAILKDKKITDFLESRGIHPVRKTSNRWLYRCPIHEEKDPSFVVYLNDDDHQTYYCYGCKSGIDVINLVSDLDKISIKDAIKNLLDGIDVDIDETANMCDKWNDIIEPVSKMIEIRDSKELEITLIKMAYWCRRYLSEHFDEIERDFFEKIYKLMDERAEIEDIEGLKCMEEMLLKGLDKRSDIFRKRQENKEVQEYARHKRGN